MKIEIEIPDLKDIFLNEYSDEEVTGMDIKKAIANIAIEKFIDRMYDNYENNRVGYSTIETECKQIVKDNQKEIIETVTNRVTEQILKKKAIVEQMPKKSELKSINKEWEDYFIELIDKSIAKKFR